MTGPEKRALDASLSPVFIRGVTHGLFKVFDVQYVRHVVSSECWRIRAHFTTSTAPAGPSFGSGGPGFCSPRVVESSQNEEERKTRQMTLNVIQIDNPLGFHTSFPIPQHPLDPAVHPSPAQREDGGGGGGRRASPSATRGCICKSRAAEAPSNRA
ncbi:hypothetical protein EYF80_034357 [Liparis tanakae]|uniref:Uncharacterized protein n=1 Tax=Liparis tanakae TaxID=230148 RepID=A0A4Z2GPC9_9TELE|nr:hypothetical protein EYF80_034357 [Liparis tanakae]